MRLATRTRQEPQFPIPGRQTGSRSMRFGEELKAQRERRGISLDDVAVSTRVSYRHLTALEEDRFAELPGGVFSRGIVRSYAQHCGLDADGTVRSFLNAMRDRGMEGETKVDDWVELAEAVHRNRPATFAPRRMRWLGALAMVFAVSLLTACVFLLLYSQGRIHLPHRADVFVQKLKR